MIHAFEAGDDWARYVDMDGYTLRVERHREYPDNVIVKTTHPGASIPVPTLRDMVRRFERPERNLLAEELDEQRKRAEAAEAKVEAVRALVGKWRVNSGVGLGAYQLRRELADELSAVLDPEPKPPYKVVCWRCGEPVASLRWTIGDGFEDGQDKLTETLCDHYETCPAVES